MSDNAAPILSRADTVNLISALRFHDSTDDERAAIHLKLTTTDAVLRLEIQRLTEERDAAQAKLRLEWSKDAVISERNTELSALRAELEAVKVDHAGDLTALHFVRSRLIGLRHEACNDELHELSEELTSILSVIDAAISQTVQPEEKR